MNMDGGGRNEDDYGTVVGEIVMNVPKSGVDV